ncbi:DUF1871 family protein [Peribacillus butanolivorans]|uniref:DUF1871 family protein n=1 Tax=Peribacillus butanolivorans TaxID=421767 RepID=UPI0035E12B12
MNKNYSVQAANIRIKAKNNGTLCYFSPKVLNFFAFSLEKSIFFNKVEKLARNLLVIKGEVKT